MKSDWKETLRVDLRQAADALIEAERAVYQAQGEYREAIALLEFTERQIILGCKLPGLNETIRKAQLRDLTGEDHLLVTSTEARLEFAKMELRCAQVNFRLLRTTVILLTGQEEANGG